MALVFVSNVFLLALLSHENLHLLPIVVSSVFSPESTPLVIQQSPLLFSANLFICVFFFICLFILLSLLIYIFSNRSLGTFFHRFRIRFRFRFHDSVSVSGFRIPCFSAAVEQPGPEVQYSIVVKNRMCNKHPLEIITWHSSTVWPETYKRHGKFLRDLHPGRILALYFSKKKINKKETN